MLLHLNLNVFDFIVIDLPWMIQSNTITRGVDLGYELMNFEDIVSWILHNYKKMFIYLFMWIFSFTLQAVSSMV